MTGGINSARCWILSLAFVLVFACGLLVAWHASAGQPLKMPQSAPAAGPPASPTVVVSDSGKTFHAPGCRYIHGKNRSMPVEEAIAAGYSPCTRCMKETVAH